MKKILIGLGLLFSISAFGAAVIFSGNDVKTLKQNIDLNAIVKIISGAVDPSSSATSANKGSLYLSTNGKGYLKQDAGSSTSWNLIAINPMSTNAEMIYGGVNGVPTKLASGTNGYVLTMGANAPAWAAASSGGMPGTNWASDLTFTTNNMGTLSSSNFFYRRVGDSLHVRASFTVGTTAAGVCSLVIPTYVIDSTKLPSNASGTKVGEATDVGGSSSGLFGSSITSDIFYDGSDTGKLYFAYTSNGSGAFTKNNCNNIWNSNEQVTLSFDIPVTAWAF